LNDQNEENVDKEVDKKSKGIISFYEGKIRGFRRNLVFLRKKLGFFKGETFLN